MPKRELYGQYHRLISELARAAGPETDWRPEFKSLLGKFEADVDALDPRSAQMLREDLSTQLSMRRYTAHDCLPPNLVRRREMARTQHLANT